MQLLRELWKKVGVDPQVRTTYKYVVSLRDRLESMVSYAHENLQNMSKKYKHHYNQKLKRRNLKVGDKVLAFLPTKANLIFPSSPIIKQQHLIN